MLLRIANLSVHFAADAGPFAAIDGVDLDISAGRTVTLVGESGCGKSLTALSILDLLPPGARVVRGAIEFEGRPIVAAEFPAHRGRRQESAARRLRGDRIAMIFQEPMTSLNPVLTIGRQIAEPLEVHRGFSRRAARTRTIELLELVGIADAATRVDEYPHRLSGGMRQRVMIAMALACEPALLIADEPTTALDVTVQAQILALLRDLQQRRGTALLFITHDLGVVAQIADEVCVMYAGRIVERAPVAALFAQPQHPYTQALLRCTPRLATPVASSAAVAQPSEDSSPGLHDRAGTPARLRSTRDAHPAPIADQATQYPRLRLPMVPGEVADPRRRPSGCAFHPRCEFGSDDDQCRRDAPTLRRLAASHECACWKVGIDAPPAL